MADNKLNRALMHAAEILRHKGKDDGATMLETMARMVVASTTAVNMPSGEYPQLAAAQARAEQDQAAQQQAAEMPPQTPRADENI